VDPDDFGGFDEGRYDDDPNPYHGDYAEDGGDFESDDDESDDEPSDDEVAEWEAQEEAADAFLASHGEDALLDSVMEDRIGGGGYDYDPGE